MSHSRREFLLGSLATLAVLPGCDRPPQNKGGKELSLRSGRRLEKRGADFLVGQQSKDGAWRSDVYGVFKDGTALTPLVLNALLSAASAQQPIDKAAAHLAALVKSDGRITAPSYGFDFALYTAALTVTG